MAERKPKQTKVTYFKDCQPLGALCWNDTQGLFVRRTGSIKTTLTILWEESSGRFGLIGKEVSIRYGNGVKENPRTVSAFRFFNDGDSWTMVYIKELRGKRQLVVATAHDIYSWLVRGTMDLDTTSHLQQPTDAVIVTTGPKRHFLYRSGLFVTCASSGDLKKWTSEPDLLFTSRHEAFDSGTVSLLGSKRVAEGILLIYDASHQEGPLTRVAAGAVLFAADDPKKVLWRSPTPIWEGLVFNEKGIVTPLGAVFSEKELILYWGAGDGSMLRTNVAMPKSVLLLATPEEKRFLQRHHKNPILTTAPHHEWEDEAVFNPAALYDNGRVHLLYRAVGHHGLSVLGYASSADGLLFDERSNEPVFAVPPAAPKPTEALERHYGPTMYPSGCSWGGVEDPRLVALGDRFYLTFTAFDDWHSIRIGVSSISQQDFRNKQWHWAEPLLISPAGERHKNWVLFPEKIGGKFAILHSLAPKVHVEYVAHLEDLASGKKVIRSGDPLRAPLATGRWDARTRGAGPPPLRTPAGWLVFYHGHEKTEPGKYKLGALLLDLKNPEKVLARTRHPVLSPDMWYENDGKPGVVYACGAILRDGIVSVYYGGADHNVCVASMPLKELLEKITK